MGITFKEIGDDCDLCPLHKQNMCHGLMNYGNGPVYPPCSEMDENTDVEQYLDHIRTIARSKIEKQEEKRKSEAEKRQKKEIQKRRKRFSDTYCKKEIQAVNQLKKTIKKLENTLDSIKTDLIFSEAMNIDGISFGNPDKLKKIMNKINEQLIDKKVILDSAQKQLSIKREESRQTEEYKNISIS